MTSVKLTRYLCVRSLHRDIHFLMVHVIIIVFSSQLQAQYCVIHIKIVTSFRYQSTGWRESNITFLQVLHLAAHLVRGPCERTPRDFWNN